MIWLPGGQSGGLGGRPGPTLLAVLDVLAHPHAEHASAGPSLCIPHRPRATQPGTSTHTLRTCVTCTRVRPAYAITDPAGTCAGRSQRVDQSNQATRRESVRDPVCNDSSFIISSRIYSERSADPGGIILNARVAPDHLPDSTLLELCSPVREEREGSPLSPHTVGWRCHGRISGAR